MPSPSIVIFCRFVQPEKASFPTPVALLGTSISVRDVQPEKAFSPMVFTMDPSAKTMLSKLVQREKASRPTLVMLAGISTFVRDVQPLKAFSPMVSMVSASFTSFRFVRPENASFSTLVTPSSSLTVFREGILSNTCF